MKAFQTFLDVLIAFQVSPSQIWIKKEYEELKMISFHSERTQFHEKHRASSSRRH